MSPQAHATITGMIFLAVADAHVLRLVGGFEFRVGTLDVPIWGSTTRSSTTWAPTATTKKQSIVSNAREA